MQANKSQKKIINEALKYWENEGIIDDAQSKRMKDSVKLQSFDWKNLAVYSFVIAVVSIVVAILSVLADEKMMELIDSLMNAGNMARIALFGLLSVLSFWLGLRRRAKKPLQSISNESLFLLGIFFSGLSLFYFGETLKLADESYVYLILIGGVLYLGLGYYFPSKITWLVGLLVLAVWYGAETKHLANGESHFLGMNMPLRFVFFTVLLLAFAYLMRRYKPLKPFANITYISGLFGLFFSFWILSVTGNYGSYDEWEKIAQIELWGYSVLLAAACLSAIYFGLKTGNNLSREFGIVFLILGIYTRYVEFLWDKMHPSIFFAVLAISFWFLGKKAEQIWKFGK